MGRRQHAEPVVAEEDPARRLRPHRHLRRHRVGPVEQPAGEGPVRRAGGDRDLAIQHEVVDRVDVARGPDGAVVAVGRADDLLGGRGRLVQVPVPVLDADDVGRRRGVEHQRVADQHRRVGGGRGVAGVGRQPRVGVGRVDQPPRPPPPRGRVVHVEDRDAGLAGLTQRLAHQLVVGVDITVDDRDDLARQADDPFDVGLGQVGDAAEHGDFPPPRPAELVDALVHQYAVAVHVRRLREVHPLTAVGARDVGEAAAPLAGRRQPDSHRVAAPRARAGPVVADQGRGHAARRDAERLDGEGAKEEEDDEERHGDGEQQAGRGGAGAAGLRRGRGGAWRAGSVSDRSWRRGGRLGRPGHGPGHGPGRNRHGSRVGAVHVRGFQVLAATRRGARGLRAPLRIAANLTPPTPGPRGTPPAGPRPDRSASSASCPRPASPRACACG